MSSFTYIRRVNFAETDAAGIAHFANFPRWVEEAETAFWRENGIHSPSLADGYLAGFPRVSFSIRYRAPVRFDDELEVHVTPHLASSSAIEWHFRIRRGATLCASGTMVVVFAQGNPLRGELVSCPMPEDILDVLKAVAPQNPESPPAPPSDSEKTAA
jgi:YbgC/YbaW family acyl-CoA thioester hydrolase